MSKKVVKDVMAAIETLDRLELQEIGHAVEQAIIAKERADIDDLRAKFEAMCANRGVATASVLSSMPRVVGKKGGTIPAKYRNPDNPSETWTGRGRQPDWLKVFIENGGTREQCALAPLAGGTVDDDANSEEAAA